MLITTTGQTSPSALQGMADPLLDAAQASESRVTARSRSHEIR